MISFNYLKIMSSVNNIESKKTIDTSILALQKRSQKILFLWKRAVVRFLEGGVAGMVMGGRYCHGKAIHS